MYLIEISEAKYVFARSTIFFLIASILLVVISGCSSEKKEELEFGNIAPTFNSLDMSGSAVNLAEMKGVPVVLRFFVPNCKYCRADTKIFNEYYQEYLDKGLKIIYVNTDPDLSEAKKFVADLGIVFPVVLDHDQSLAKLYRVKVVPQTIVLDPAHSIIGAILGGVSKAELDDLLLKFF